MKRPEVTLKNYRDVYAYYQANRPNRLVAGLGHATMNALWRPNVHLSTDTEQQLADLLASGTQLAIIANHQSYHDPIVVAAAARTPVLRPLIGHTTIPAMDRLFRHPVLRRAVDAMGAVPTFRSKDHADLSTQRAAGIQLTTTMVERLRAGYHVAMFPEGGRNKGDVTRLQELKTGIGHIVSQAALDTSVALVPLGIYYGAQDAHRHAEVAIGEPITDGLESYRTVHKLATEGLQLALTQAVRYHEALSATPPEATAA